VTTKKHEKPMTTHVDRTTTPYTGPVKVDASTVASILVDLPKGARKGLRTSGPGIDAVAAELAAEIATAGAKAGIAPAVYQSFLTNHNNATSLEEIGQTLFKLAEVVGETLALTVDAREQALSKIVDSIQSTAKRDKNDGIKAPFHQTLAYKSRIAEKAVKTKAAKKAAKAGAPTATPAATPAQASTTATSGH
jgi:hypothetical protein